MSEGRGQQSSSTSRAPLLNPELVDRAKHIGSAIRAGRVAALVGAGTSVSAGLPVWTDLVNRVILAWQRWERDVPGTGGSARRLSPANYVELIRHVFESDLAIISYLRRRLEEMGGPAACGQLLYAALYAHPGQAGQLFSPLPTDLHRQLVALFRPHPNHLWTTNYDDLIEEAAGFFGEPVLALHPDQRRIDRALAICHLHGCLVPPARFDPQRHLDPGAASVIMAEDDFHAIAAQTVGWTNREFYRLFDEHQVLIVGMSLNDPNLRRVLATVPPSATSTEPIHFALLPALTAARIPLSRVGSRRRGEAVDDASAYRTWYWRQYGIDVVPLPINDLLLPFLVRLRYESFGDASGALWEKGAELGYTQVDPWRPDRQRAARDMLLGAMQGLRQDFAVADPDEIVEIGIFLLRPGQTTLELAFRAGAGEIAERGARVFSADPDRPTGTAGRVLVSGDLVRVTREHELHDYGLARPQPSATRYEGVISAPIFDWAAGGIPLGVIYLTTSRADGVLFGLEETPPMELTEATGPKALTLADLGAALSDVGLRLLRSFRPL